MRTLPFALVLLGLPLCAQAGPQNDTGIDFCRNQLTSTDTAVTLTTTCSLMPIHGGQDARYGRDAAAAKGVLSKIGGGGKGFDFTKIANDGSILPAGAALGSNATDWGCTYDNNTGLMWEVKTNNGMRNQAYTYTWYDSVHHYDGNPGTGSGGICLTPGRCDTEKFVADVNTVGLCGHSDWRTPVLTELFNLADRGRTAPAIDPTYFPNTRATFYWTSAPYAGSSFYAWVTGFNYGFDVVQVRSTASPVRLVRTGQ